MQTLEDIEWDKAFKFNQRKNNSRIEDLNSQKVSLLIKKEKVELSKYSKTCYGRNILNINKALEEIENELKELSSI